MNQPPLWPAPAKLNLMLRIVGRRPDGYHLLQTVFQFLDQGDNLSFDSRSDGLIRRVSTVEGVSQSDDLVVRAALLLQKEAGIKAGVDIAIEKNIPMGGGLGGGSSDAATTLVALNQIWDCGFSRQRLARLGLSLGADVPVFVTGHAAWAEGVGEELTPVELPEPWYLVVVPGCHVSTKDIFTDPELTRDAPRTTIRAFLAEGGVNDCLPVVLKHYPLVAEAVSWLSTVARPQLTGTGSCLFAAFSSESSAQDVLQMLPAKFKGFVARGLNRSPLEQLVG